MSKVECWKRINGVCVKQVKCGVNSCRIDCISETDGFCCIENTLTNRLLQVLGVQPNSLVPDYDICASDGAYASEVACGIGLIRVVEIIYSYYSTCPKIFQGHEFYQLSLSDTVLFTTSGGGMRCGVFNPNISWFRTSDNFRLGGGEIISMPTTKYTFRSSVPNPNSFSIRLV